MVIIFVSGEKSAQHENTGEPMSGLLCFAVVICRPPDF
jgi:hypothetical protein